MQLNAWVRHCSMPFLSSKPPTRKRIINSSWTYVTLLSYTSIYLWRCVSIINRRFAGAGEKPESGWDVLGEWSEGMSFSHVAFLVAAKRVRVRRKNPKIALVHRCHVNALEGARDMSRDIYLGPGDPYGRHKTCTQSLGRWPERWATRSCFSYWYYRCGPIRFTLSGSVTPNFSSPLLNFLSFLLFVSFNLFTILFPTFARPKKAFLFSSYHYYPMFAIF